MEVVRLWEPTEHRKGFLNCYGDRSVDGGHAKRMQSFIAQGQIYEQPLVICNMANNLKPYFRR